MTEMTPEQMREHLMTAPVIGDGPPVWQRGLPSDDAYEMTAKAMGRAFLELAEADPSLLEPSAKNPGLWAALKARWPDARDWLGGPSGFQYGWAENAARFVLGAPEVPNPALIQLVPRD